MNLFEELERINERPEPFQFYTASTLWTDEHSSGQMLSFHLDGTADISSRNAAFIKRSVDWIAREFQVGSTVTIADFGCGPGLYAGALAKRGAGVTGIDFSERSIRHAREVAAREQLPIKYHVQNYLEFETDDRFDLVMMIMCDFCALSPVQRKAILKIFYNILKPGGSVLLDVYSLSAFESRKEFVMYEPNQLDGFWSANRYYGFLNTFKYREEKVVLDQYTIVEADRVKKVYNWLQYFAPGDLEREFVAAGFSVKAVYADVAGSPYDPDASEFAVIANRK